MRAWPIHIQSGKAKVLLSLTSEPANMVLLKKEFLIIAYCLLPFEFLRPIIRPFGLTTSPGGFSAKD